MPESCSCISVPVDVAGVEALESSMDVDALVLVRLLVENVLVIFVLAVNPSVVSNEVKVEISLVVELSRSPLEVSKVM